LKAASSKGLGKAERTGRSIGVGADRYALDKRRNMIAKRRHQAC